MGRAARVWVSCMAWVVNNNIPSLAVAGLTVAHGSGQRVACPARPSLAARFGVTMAASKKKMHGRGVP